MKQIQRFTALVFGLLILLPLVGFRLESNAVSEIDNRMLTEFPVGGDLTTGLESYVNDRIGFRDEMILGYTVLNDRLFGKMVHPSYTYGKDGYVFGAGLTVSQEFGDFHRAFADLVANMQEYCLERGVPFLFVLNPAKPAVLTEYIADGVHYDRTWVREFLEALEERGVRYLDNTETLLEAHRAGEVVFNQKYDANHWNDYGALVGCNAMVQALQSDFPGLALTQEEDYDCTMVEQTSLPVSQFPISELVPQITVHTVLQDLTDDYRDELYRHPSYRTMGYYVNEQAMEAGSPRALVFQGSYMNGIGYKFLANSFGEYIYIHDYQNVMELDYYFNLFQPQCVIFEVAEYTFSNGYFDYEKMKATDFQGTLEAARASCEIVAGGREVASAQIGKMLTTLTWHCADDCAGAWLLAGNALDMEPCAQGFRVTLTTEQFREYGEALVLYAQRGDTLVEYTLEADDAAL